LQWSAEKARELAIVTAFDHLVYPAMALLSSALLQELEALRAAAAPPPLPVVGAGGGAGAGGSPPAQPQPQPRRLEPGALRRLDCLLRGDAVLERALEHVDNGDVERCVTPHGRAFFSVASASARAARARGAGAFAAAAAAAAADAPSQSQAFPRLSFGGGGGGAPPALAYTVLVDGAGACSCFDFGARVLLGGARMRLGIVDARHARAVIVLPPEEELRPSLSSLLPVSVCGSSASAGHAR